MIRGGGVSAVDVSDELARRLQGLSRAVSPDEIGELWIFPPLSDVDESAEFVLFTRRLEEDRRRVYSARIAPGHGNGGPPGAGDDGTGAASGAGAGRPESVDGGPGPGQVITDHGSVPSGRVQVLVERFRRRLDDEGEPLHVAIEGRRERWTSLLDGG